ncbi:MAG: 50S ribosomal protein L19e [Nanoarchaeota archaeon]|nr:50S ribosomal protein L19e [Nanoarchaeota archaeon]MBU1004873.1 50S ribosomal protein L19e [Nanoarchaeota archaeon]MBU1946315.1 50S ribosomal protein L19e [Nanoarchaeota archaeon]
MDLSNQKRLAADLCKCSPKRIRFDEDRLEDIKEAITKVDIRGLINDNAITKLNKRGVSRVRARKRLVQRRKGKQKGPGARKGSRGARLTSKRAWINKVRAQRQLLNALKGKTIDKKLYRELYLKSKGGFFRSKRHIKIHLEERVKK